MGQLFAYFECRGKCVKIRTFNNLIYIHVSQECGFLLEKF